MRQRRGAEAGPEEVLCYDVAEIVEKTPRGQSYLISGAVGGFTVVAVAAGCDQDAVDPALGGRYEAALLKQDAGGAEAPARSVLQLADKNSEILRALSLDVDVVQAESPEIVRAKLRQIDAVALDVELIETSDYEGWASVMRDAYAARIPVILEHARGELVAKAFGAGIDARLLYITAVDGTTTMKVYGGSSDSLDELELEPIEGEGLGDQVVERLEAQAPSLDAEFVAQHVSDLLRAGQSPAAVTALESETPVHRVILLDNEPHYRIIRQEGNKKQEASWDQDIQVELVADNPETGKKMLVRPLGSGWHPGSLWQNDGGERGYYTREIAHFRGRRHGATARMWRRQASRALSALWRAIPKIQVDTRTSGLYVSAFCQTTSMVSASASSTSSGRFSRRYR